MSVAGPQGQDTGLRYCGRTFTAAELDTIRGIIASRDRYPTRAAISRAVCGVLDWRKADGQPKVVSCRVALLRMQQDGWIMLPAAHRAPPRCGPTTFTSASDLQPDLSVPRHALGPLELRVVEGQAQARLWRELIARYHFLGYTPLGGAQIRYFAYAGERLLAALGFGSAAWKLAPRDAYIGWTPEQRQARLHLVVQNARFLIVPWVQSKNLASSLLALAARQLPQDFQLRYGYQPVLLETFVEWPRHAGTCYRAANWVKVGRTQGRGKHDRYARYDKPRKDVYLYPLRRDFRRVLCAGEPTP